MTSLRPLYSILFHAGKWKKMGAMFHFLIIQEGISNPPFLHEFGENEA
jgi:hypothetical protein